MPDSFFNAVAATRNLLESALEKNGLERLVNTSSFAVYDVASKRGSVSIRW
jgi:nucleoside-diphosphate-sugar epimerase